MARLLWALLLSSALFTSALMAGASDTPYESTVLRPFLLPAEHRTQLPEEDWQWLRAKETLILGTYPLVLPPFELGAANNELEGVTADFIALIARELSIKVAVRSFPSYEAALHALASGEIDMLGTTSELNSSKSLALTVPYVHTLPVIFTRSAESWAQSEQATRDKTVAYNPLYIPQSQAATLFPGAKLKAVASNMDMFSAVAFGDADAGVSSSISAYFIINKHYPNELRVARMLDVPGLDGYSFALRQDNARLLQIINAAITQGVSPEQSQAILQRWSGGGVARTQRLPLSDGYRHWIARHPVVRVGVAENFPPFSYFGDDGNFYGITADFLSVIQAETGLQIQVQRFATIQGILRALESKQIDIAADFAPTTARLDAMEFSRPYLATPIALVVRHEMSQATSIADLRGKSLVLPRNHALIPYLREHYPDIQLIESQDVPDAFDAVASRKADALLQPLNTARYYILRLYKDKLRISTTLSEMPALSAFALRREDDELRGIINEALLNFSPNDVSMLNSRWLSQVILAPQSWRSYRVYLYQGALIGSLLLLAFLGWNFYLWQQVRKRRRAELALNEQLLFMDALINGTPHPIYVRDTEMRMLMCNDSYLRQFEVTRGDVLGSAFLGYGALHPDDVRALEADHAKVIHERKPVLLDRRLLFRGTPKTIYHWLLPYENASRQVVGVIGGWIDISERDELVAKLESARDQANQANRTKTTFLATMSHEIRTPLNAVIGMLELVLKGAHDGAQDRTLLEAAHTSARGLLDLIGEILDISRIESGKLTLTPQRANPKRLIESVVQVFDGLARQKSLSLSLQLDPQLDQDVLIDPLRFKQVLSNLVSNAIKFTHSGEVKVDSQLLSAEDDQLELQLSVIDSGIGIAPQDQERLFQAFSQVKESTGGAGLGLMISRSLCGLMGGSLTLSSQIGVGTQVRVNLKVSRLESVPQDSPDTAPIPRLPELRILIVDDHSMNRALLTHQLDFLGQQVSSAEDGARALEIWKQHDFDLVITDCNMPLMDGFALTAAIREEEKQRDATPCVILGLTANALPELRDRCLSSGMDGCLFKPIELGDLEQTLRAFEWPVRGHDSLDIDFAQLSTSTGDNPELIRTLLQEMLGSCHHDLEKLRLLSSTTHLQDLDDLAHRVKGAGKVLKAGKLVQRCEELESACRLRQFSAIDEQQHELIAYLERFCAVLEVELDDSPAER